MSFWVVFCGNKFLVLLKRDPPFRLGFDFWPSVFVQDRPGEPAEFERRNVNLAQEIMDRDSASV